MGKRPALAEVEGGGPWLAPASFLQEDSLVHGSVCPWPCLWGTGGSSYSGSPLAKSGVAVGERPSIAAVWRLLHTDCSRPSAGLSLQPSQGLLAQLWYLREYRACGNSADFWSFGFQALPCRQSLPKFLPRRGSWAWFLCILSTLPEFNGSSTGASETTDFGGKATCLFLSLNLRCLRDRSHWLFQPFKAPHFSAPPHLHLALQSSLFCTGLVSFL